MRHFVNLAGSVLVGVVLITVVFAGAAQRVALPAEQPLTFANLRTTGGDDPHAYGVQIELYRHGATWAGFISEHTGSVADPPVGTLDALQVNESAGTLTFTAKLSLGVSRKGNDWRPTRDVYDFAGRIDANTISGVLMHRLDGDAGGESRDNVVLNRQPRGTMLPSYETWIEHWTGLMKTRGPKW